MSARSACRGAILAFGVLLAGCTAAPRAAIDDDAPESRPASGTIHPATWADALATWRTPEQVNAWIGDAFEYDRERAVRLSARQREALGTLPIHEPASFYERPAGICVDLARFGVETLNAVAPQAKARYLMIEFDPVTVRGEALRRHWLVAFEREDGLYFLADSKRPGHLAGPYPGTAQFVAEYAQYRGREVLSYRELASWRKQAKAKAATKRPVDR